MLPRTQQSACLRLGGLAGAVFFLTQRRCLHWWWKRCLSKWLHRRLCLYWYIPRKLQKEVRIATGLAFACGENILTAADVKNTEFKDINGIDPCTETDKANEELVIEGLRRAFPSHGFIGEETASAAKQLPGMVQNQLTWICDPIDGTQNFVHGLSLCCVSIGLALNGQPILGIVYDPHLDELFIGFRVSKSSYGAFLDGRKIQLPPRATVSKLQDSLVLIDPGYERNDTTKLEASYSKLLQAKTRAIRIVGSTVLSLCWLAAGRANAVLIGFSNNDAPKPWDFCAATLIADCAGAAVSMIDDRRHLHTSPKIEEKSIAIEEAKQDTAFDLYSKSVLAASDPELLGAIRASVLEV